jgi:hypothetical protein
LEVGFRKIRSVSFFVTHLEVCMLSLLPDLLLSLAIALSLLSVTMHHGGASLSLPVAKSPSFFLPSIEVLPNLPPSFPGIEALFFPFTKSPFLSLSLALKLSFSFPSIESPFLYLSLALKLSQISIFLSFPWR